MEEALEDYNKLLRMLKSSDPENQGLALTMLEKNFSVNNVMQTLWLYKRGIPDFKMWKEQAPDATTYMTTTLGLNLENDVPLTFSAIFNSCYKVKIDIEQINFGLQLFADFMTTDLIRAGYTWVDQVTIEVKLKTTTGNDDQPF